MTNIRFEDCRKRGKIREFSRGKALVSKELGFALSDLRAAQESFKNKNYKWSTIQTYYSMFHSARALLYQNNYREKSHVCLIEAVRAFYTDKGLLDYTLLEAFQRAKRLREEADYYGEFSKVNAKDLLDKAQEFLNKASEILKQRT
jgi:uncharacterized protein (UPF0332 family)